MFTASTAIKSVVYRPLSLNIVQIKRIITVNSLTSPYNLSTFPQIHSTFKKNLIFNDFFDFFSFITASYHIVMTFLRETKLIIKIIQLTANINLKKLKTQMR